MLDSTNNFIYGIGGRLSLESYLTEHLVFIVHGQLRFLLNNHIGVSHALLGFGIRFNF
ncbi:conjugal transfer protein TraO [Chryseobacterium sp. 22532]|uniref:conjugal transfer protein TraO n=1 Tax=Chryseobacterium sp. 22532 TaxID=3453938 RepID=UPI003F840923